MKKRSLAAVRKRVQRSVQRRARHASRTPRQPVAPSVKRDHSTAR